MTYSTDLTRLEEVGSVQWLLPQMEFRFLDGGMPSG